MKMKTLLVTLSSCLFGLSAGAMADPAVYRGNTMNIDSGVLITNSKQQYYTNIVLNADANGKLTIVSAKQRPLVYIDNVIPTVVENAEERSVTLTIAGNKSVPCVELEEVAVSRKDEVFTVLIAETELGPAESCIAMLDPFEIDVPLDVYDLHSGTYKLIVNGEESGFVLTQEQPAPTNP